MKINVEVVVPVSADQAWHAWVSPESITRWNFASDDWCCPRAELDLVPGGKFNYRMEARDGSMGFDFEGVFTDVQAPSLLVYTIADGRTVTVRFEPDVEGTRVIEEFDADAEYSVDQQREGWQAILDNFKRLLS